MANIITSKIIVIAIIIDLSDLKASKTKRIIK